MQQAITQANADPDLCCNMGQHWAKMYVLLP